MAPPDARKPLLLTFDVEEFDWPGERGRPLRRTTQLGATTCGLRRLLPLLARRGVRATFFVTGEYARGEPQVVRGLVEHGHEVAVHGLAHSDDYATMRAADAVERLRAARTVVEHSSGHSAQGVRTPRLRPCAAAVLAAAGFSYDASPHPTWVPGRYNGLHLPRSPWWEDGVLRVPISVLPWVRLPVSWIWYRWAGARLGGIAASAAALRAPYLHLYFHPWEAVDIRRLGIPSWLAVRTGPAFVRALDRLLASSAQRLVPMPVRDFVAAYTAAEGTDSAAVRAAGV
jgi:peptidoglycan/xylan/chitin deacetylase (PgdA/CDA1 family)